MPLVTHGNLAVKTGEISPDTKKKEAVRPVKPKLVIPLGEKLAYLFAILFCMAVAGAVLWQYAQIYSVNTRIQEIEREIVQLEKENRMLELEAQRLREPKRLIEMGKALGFVQGEEGSAIPVTPDKYVLSEGKQVAVADGRNQ